MTILIRLISMPLLRNSDSNSLNRPRIFCDSTCRRKGSLTIREKVTHPKDVGGLPMLERKSADRSHFLKARRLNCRTNPMGRSNRKRGPKPFVT